MDRTSTLNTQEMIVASHQKSLKKQVT